MFPVIVVPDDAPRTQEQLGTKSKFWYEDETTLYLFKENRAETAEDCAEKIAAFLGEQLGIPHAEYELALWQGKRGIVTRAIHGETERLFLGNELLGEIIPDYGAYTAHRGGNKKHTLDNVMRCLRAYSPPPGMVPPLAGIDTAAEAFVGYLMLDALIGNNDRHHENWGCIAASNGSDVRLAPSYDHASSMGRELTDVRREEMLTTRDKNRTVEAYCRSEKSRSALYRTDQEAKTLTVQEAFALAARQFPAAGRGWLARLDALTEGMIREGFAQIPEERLSPFGVECAVGIVSYHQRRLLNQEIGG